jgi:8-oxo-dGTP pyrophosphatase MutT (NUDIX family)
VRFYYFIGRLSSPLQQAFFIIYNAIFHVPRARVLVWNEDNEVLLVRNWAGKRQWGLPGGGVERGEKPIAAAKRELFEEVGIALPLNAFTYIATISYQYEAPIYSVTIQKSTLPSVSHNPREIIATQWFAPENLPTDLSPLVPLALKNLSKSD